jgi:hypothetical protein
MKARLEQEAFNKKEKSLKQLLSRQQWQQKVQAREKNCLSRLKGCFIPRDMEIHRYWRTPIM